MDIYEKFTVCQHLSKWPESASFAEIIYLVRHQDKRIEACENYNPRWSLDMADIMQDFHAALVMLFVSRK